MKLNSLVLLICIVFSIFSCKEESKQSIRFQDTFQAERYTILTPADSVIIIDKVIPLETNPQSIISFPYEMCTISDHFVIASRGMPIHVFSPDGKYLRSLGRIGSGPSEYRDISAIFEVSNSTVGIFDPALQRVSFFQISGESIDSKQVPFPRSSIRCITAYDNRLYFLYRSSKALPYHIIETDNQLKIIRKFQKADYKYEKYYDEGAVEGRIVIDTIKHCLFEANQYFNRIYTVDLHTGIEDELQLHKPPAFRLVEPLGRQSTPEELRFNKANSTQINRIYLLHSNILFIVYWDIFNSRCLVRYGLINLKTQKALYTKPTNNNITCGDTKALYTLDYSRINRSSPMSPNLSQNPCVIKYSLINFPHD